MGMRFLIVVLMAVLARVHGGGITVPGTKWCGPGNIADGYDDLGTEIELDMCCRTHDHCEGKILPYSHLHGLTNIDIFPIFSCDCESAFRQCLSSLRNMESAALGRIYFSTRKVCFAYGPPITSCREHQWDLFMKRCLSYDEDVLQPERFQFYDMPFYTHPSDEQ